MSRCKACEARDKHIESLKLMISDLRTLALPQGKKEVSLIQLEQDAILSGNDETMQISAEEFQKQQEVESEADRLLAGTY